MPINLKMYFIKIFLNTFPKDNSSPSNDNEIFYDFINSFSYKRCIFLIRDYLSNDICYYPVEQYSIYRHIRLQENILIRIFRELEVLPQ